MRCGCPWDEAERRGDVEVITAPLPAECGGAVVQRRPGRAWVVLDPDLDPAEQRCRLAHELVHLERGSVRAPCAPPSWDAVVAREELAVDREVASWLVPSRELARFVRGHASADLGITSAIVATEFEVTEPIAALALADLRDERLR